MAYHVHRNILVPLCACGLGLALSLGSGDTRLAAREARTPFAVACQAVELAPRLAENEEPLPRPAGVYAHHAVPDIARPAGTSAWLASTPDGTGALRVDDRLIVATRRLDGSGIDTLTIDFFSGDRRQIGERPPQPVDHLFPVNIPVTIEVQAIDLVAPRRSMSPLFVIFIPDGTRMCAGTTSTPTTTITPVVTPPTKKPHVFAGMITPTLMERPAMTPTASDEKIATATPGIIATTVITPVVSGTAASGTSLLLIVGVTVAITALALCGGAVLWLARRQGPSSSFVTLDVTVADVRRRLTPFTATPDVVPVGLRGLDLVALQLRATPGPDGTVVLSSTSWAGWHKDSQSIEAHDSIKLSPGEAIEHPARRWLVSVPALTVPTSAGSSASRTPVQ